MARLIYYSFFGKVSSDDKLVQAYLNDGEEIKMSDFVNPDVIKQTDIVKFNKDCGDSSLKDACDNFNKYYVLSEKNVYVVNNTKKIYYGEKNFEEVMESLTGEKIKEQNNDELNKAYEDAVEFAKRQIEVRKKLDELEKKSENVNQEDNDKSVKKHLADLIEKKNKQIVLTGAPGTGKTYGVRKYIKGQLGEGYENSDRFKFVQFHSSYDYTDFIEGLKPLEINGEQCFKKMDGVFKAFCRKATELATEFEKYMNNIECVTKSKYTDIKDRNKWRVRLENEFGITYYFVIDEINRADLSRVFGEIMFCLEESYRGPRNKINTQYQSLKTYDADGKLMDGDVFADGFYIPENVIIIGTMNDIDRSVETFDFALRRRFKWEEVDAMESMEEDLGLNKDDNLYKRIYALNIAIEKNLGKDFQLGMAYFRKAKEQEEKFNAEEYAEEYYNDELKFILNEYVRGMNDKDDKLKDFEKFYADIKDVDKYINDNTSKADSKK